MTALFGWLFLIVIGGILMFAVARLIRFFLGRRSEKQRLDDAGDIADAAKVGLGLLAVATFFLAPVGLMALLAGMKLVSVPTIVTITPGLVLIFGGLALLASAAKIYSRRRAQRN